MLASGLAVTISIEFSISATLWCGAVSYLLLRPIAVMLSKIGVEAQQLKPTCYICPRAASFCDQRNPDFTPAARFTAIVHWGFATLNYD